MNTELQETANALKCAKYEIITTGLCQTGDKIVTAITKTKIEFRYAEKSDSFDLLVRPPEFCHDLAKNA